VVKDLIIVDFANTKYRNNKCFTLLCMLTLKLCEECKGNKFTSEEQVDSVLCPKFCNMKMVTAVDTDSW
jgi:hypothetical protein